jgi:hypothetical protein
MPTAPNTYRYTVDAFEINKYGTDKESFPAIYGVKFNTSKSVMIDSNVIYRITVYKTTDALSYNGTIIPDGGVTISGDGNVKSRVLSSGRYATFKEKVKAICDVKGIRTIEDKFYDFTLVPKGINGTVSPDFQVQVEINGVWSDVNTSFGPVTSSAGNIPSSIFTKKATSPGVPDSVSRTDGGFSFGQTPQYEWNSCEREWARMWLHDAKQVNRTADEAKKNLGPKWEVTVTVKYYNELGNFIRENTLNNKREFNYDFTKKGSGYQKAKALLSAAKNCAVPNSGGNNTAPVPGPGPGPTPPSVKKASNFNPYPHLSTRHFSARVDSRDDVIEYENANKYDQLASFYVDPEILDLPDKKQAEFATSNAANLDKLWGFRFLFNPSYISINMSSNNKVDWTRPNENGAVLIADGIGGTISVNILLDRVADMATMKQWKKNGGGPLTQAAYPVTMDAEQCAGILHRGTEYDLEYLFRVVNGNPQKVILMGESPKDGLELLSANMGYMTQIPFIFKISERQRYKVILESINIEHSMFTRDMIPIRTVVQIGLQRLPDLVSGQFSKFKQAESINKISTVLASQAVTTNFGMAGRDR